MAFLFRIRHYSPEVYTPGVSVPDRDNLQSQHNMFILSVYMIQIVTALGQITSKKHNASHYTFA